MTKHAHHLLRIMLSRKVEDVEHLLKLLSSSKEQAKSRGLASFPQGYSPLKLLVQLQVKGFSCSRWG